MCRDKRIKFLKEKITIAEDIIDCAMEKNRKYRVKENVLIDLIQITGYFTLVLRKELDGNGITGEEYREVQTMNVRMEEIMRLINYNEEIFTTGISLKKITIEK